MNYFKNNPIKDKSLRLYENVEYCFVKMSKSCPYFRKRGLLLVPAWECRLYDIPLEWDAKVSEYKRCEACLNDNEL